MKSIGINDAGVAIIVVIFTLVMMVANIPLGVLADRWSRKGVLAVATVFLISGTIIEGFSGNFLAYLVGSCLWGLYYAGYTGTYDSVVYDVLVEETGSATKFELYYGKIQLYDGIALVLSSLLCTAVVHFFTLRAAYFVTIPFSCMALVTLWAFREPQVHKNLTKSLLGAHIRETLRAIFRRKEILWLTLSLMLLTIATRIVLEFDQLWLIALAMPLFLYGPINALLLTAYGASGIVANLVKNRRMVIMAFGLTTAIASICLLYHVLTLTIMALFTIIAAVMALEVVVNRWLHDMLTSNIRAGASSTITTLGYAAFLPVGLIFGYVSHESSIFRASWIIIITCVLLALTLVKASGAAHLQRAKLAPDKHFKLS